MPLACIPTRSGSRDLHPGYQERASPLGMKTGEVGVNGEVAAKGAEILPSEDRRNTTRFDYDMNTEEFMYVPLIGLSEEWQDEDISLP